MQALIMAEPGAIRVGEWEDPKPSKGEVIVAPRAVGVCAGDVYIYLGKNAYVSYPVIGGHEFSGVVVDKAADVEGWEIGTNVAVEPFIGCGKCYPCKIGKSNCCRNLQIIGVTRPGGFAELTAVPADRLHRMPEGISFTDASFVEPVAIGVQACRRAGISSGEYVLVIGCGPIGLAIIEVARARGAQVVATDVVPSRMEMAAKFGAETLPPGEDLLPAIMEQTKGEGAPVVVEATGSVEAMESTVDLVAAGGSIVIVGLVKKGTKVAIPGLDITKKEMTILGSRASVNCFPEALKLLAEEKVHYPTVATEFDMWEGTEVIPELAENPGKYQKAVLTRS